MLDYLWTVMLAVGVLWGLFNGRADEVTQGVLSGAKDAVTLGITMLGIMSAWTGVMKIAERSGLINGISEKMSPFMRFMFPDVKKNTPAYNYMCTNIAANVLGLGWAATPAGLKAMEELSGTDVSEAEGRSGGGPASFKSKAASNAMCTFLILNISSLQLIPVNIIAYRSQYGSVEPAGIILPAIAATLVSTLTAVLFCKIMMRRTGKASVTP